MASVPEDVFKAGRYEQGRSYYMILRFRSNSSGLLQGRSIESRLSFLFFNVKQLECNLLE